MKDEISTASWEDLTVGSDWTSLGRELLANSSTANIEDTRDPNLDGSPPPGGGGVSAIDDGADLKGPNGGGCRGVYFDHIRHLWRANWPEETIVMDRDSKRPIEVRRCTRTKGFSAKKFGFQESKRMAVAHRKSMITSGAIRKYIYQEGGPVALASAISSASSGASTVLHKKPLRDKKRRKQLEKPLSPNAAAAAAAAAASQAAGSPTSSASASAGIGAPIVAAPIANVPPANNGLNLSPQVGVVASTDPDLVDVEQRPLSMELMLCLDQQAAAAAVAAAVDAGAASTSTTTSSPSTTNGSPISTSVAYDFSFL